MDTQQLQAVVEMLGQLGQYSLTGFIVWVVAQLLEPVITALGVIGGIWVFAKGIIRAIEACFKPAEYLKRVRDEVGLGTPGSLTESETNRVIRHLDNVRYNAKEE